MVRINNKEITTSLFNCVTISVEESIDRCYSIMDITNLFKLGYLILNLDSKIKSWAYWDGY